MIDDNVNLISMVEDYFEDNQKIEIVGKAYDGIEGLELIKNEDIKYDLVILDLIMPKKDGLSVLKELNKEDIHPNVIVATSYNAPDTIRKVSEYGVTYYILKPFDLFDLEDRILDTFNTLEKKSLNLFNNNLQQSISRILHELGMPSHIKGYQYIRTAITMVYDNPEIVGAIIYLVIINKDSDNNDNRNDKNNDVVEDNKDNKEDSAISYVACDGNTALLNVRNSVTGDIIDGLSCYQEVKIEEELEGNDACDKWYKISYKKRDNNYTGYACGTYIKKSNVKESTMSKVKEIIDKANEYYEKTMVMPYCGNTTDVKDITFKNDDGSTFTGEYVKSEYKNIDEIKSYLASFASSSLFKTDLKLSDINNPKQYDDYYEIDGNLYCRNYSGKGWKSNYTGNYNIEITSSSDNKYLVNISYEYLNDDSKCELKDLSKCSNNNFKYDIGKIVIENDIITKMDFHG